MNLEIIKNVQQCFETKFGTTALTVFSPGRINLIGEHTDYNDGFVFPAAINLGIVVAIQKTNSNSTQVIALDKNETHTIDLNSIKPIKDSGWRNYIVGVIGELIKIEKFIGNFNAVFAGNIPGGAGMSSSAALENSFVYGLNKLFDLGLKKKEMILISQKAEHNYAGVNCGIMDQYASMFGKNNKAFMLDCRSLKSKSYKIKLRKLKFVLVNTNVKHDLSESAYNNRRSVCEKVAKLLKVKALRDASEEQLQKIKDHISDSDYNKALYVIKENDRVQKFARAIKKNNYSAMGALMYKSHEGLSENYKVSCDELDFLVERTKAMPDVYGARMMGGGFGGCTINLMLGNFVEDFKNEIEKGFLKQFDRTCSIYEVNIAKGTHLINAKNE